MFERDALVAKCQEMVAQQEYPDLAPGVTGGTAGGVQHFMAWLAGQLEPGMTYLEVGCWLGKSTIPPAKAAPEGVEVVVCDNFTHSGEQRKQFHANLAANGLAGRVKVHDCDFKDLFTRPDNDIFKRPDPPRNIAAYFYDGDHSTQYQRLALTLAKPFLVPGAVIVVDDWFNSGGGSQVRDGTKEALAESLGEFELVFEFPCGGPWWLGLGVVRYVGPGGGA